MEGEHNLLESFEDMKLEDMNLDEKLDIITKIIPGEKEEITLDFTQCPFLKLDKANYKSKKLLLVIQNYWFKNIICLNIINKWSQ